MIPLRFYLTIGFVALIGFAVLGATSTDGMIRRIGGKRWQQMHRIVYGLGGWRSCISCCRPSSTSRSRC